MSMETIKKLYKMVSNSNNSSAMLETVLSQNPQMQQIANMISKNGLNYQQVFYQLANKYCCCTSPTTLQVVTGDVAVEGLHINVCVTRIC